MKLPAEYLHAAKVHELAEQFRGNGYDVIVEPTGPDAGFDLLARRAGKTVAVDVKVRDEMAVSAEQLRGHVDLARKRGYNDFRIVVATPPREVGVEIEGFGDKLCEWLASDLPEELTQLSTVTRVEDVVDVEYESITIDRGGIHVRGNGLIEVELEWGGGEARDGAVDHMGFPFSFAVTLSRDFSIQSVNELDIDTSSFDGD